MFNIQSYKKNVATSLCFILVVFTLHINADENNTKIAPYQFMHQKDFVSTTGCSNEYLFSYARAIKTALNFLVFSEYHDGSGDKFRFNRDLEYTHRHSSNLFNSIIKSTKCQQPNLMRMGIEIQLYNLDGSKNENAYETIQKSVKLELKNPKQYNISTKTDKPIFEVLNRFDYMELTGCLVSPNSYHKYHLALFNNLNHHLSDFAAEQMRGFLNDVGGGMSNEDGTEIAKKCLHKSVKILAEDLGLLNAAGSYVLQ